MAALHHWRELYGTSPPEKERPAATANREAGQGRQGQSILPLVLPKRQCRQCGIGFVPRQSHFQWCTQCARWHRAARHARITARALCKGET